MVCKNCESKILDHSVFCSICGEKTQTSRVTIKRIFARFNEEFFSLDNKLLRTFKDLLIRPEVVIESYLSGIRKRYVNVISYLMLSLSLFGFQFYLIQKFYSKGFNNDIESTGLKEFDELIQTSTENIGDYIGFISIATIPLLAISTYLLFSNNRQHNFAEHIVINIFITAQYTILFVFSFFFLMLFNINVNVSFTLMTILSLSLIHI